MQEEPKEPLDYAKPQPTGPPASKVLGMTAAVILLLPIGLVLGLVLPVAMFWGLSMAFTDNKGLAIGLYFVGLTIVTIAIIALALRSSALMRVVLAVFSLGAIFATLILSKCGFQ